MAYKIRRATFGSVSHGTMRTRDLLESLSAELDYQMKRQPKRFPRKSLRNLINDTRRCLTTYEDDLPAESDFLLDELFTALGEFAPDYGYFDAHEGDGSDYGYWPKPDLQIIFDGLTVNDLCEIPRDYRGEVMVVSDHGNLTLGVMNSRGKFREIWGIV